VVCAASSSAITLQRELLEAIDGKFTEIDHNDLNWPSLEPRSLTQVTNADNSHSPSKERLGKCLGSADSDSDDKQSLQAYWETVKLKHATSGYITGDIADLDGLPANWAVVSISVTDDHNTMFISRHQKGHEAIVFCIPLDRQGRREGEEDLFTFDAGVAELSDIIRSSDEAARAAKTVQGQEGKAAWWAGRKALDKRMEEMLSNLEFCWLGAFKVSQAFSDPFSLILLLWQTILNPRNTLPTNTLNDFGNKLEKIFLEALSGSGPELKKGARARLDTALLECFATLSSKCKDEEIEDLVYFILDIYQFHGVPVALAELDIDQVDFADSK